MRLKQPRHGLDADDGQITTDGVRFPLGEVDTVAYGARPFGGREVGLHATLFFLRLGRQGTSRSYEIAEQDRFSHPTFAECPENSCQLLDLVELAVCGRLADQVTAAIERGRQVVIGDLTADRQGLHRTGTRRKGLFGTREEHWTTTTEWADVASMRVVGNTLRLATGLVPSL
jgi:hypothetical protein